METTHPIYTVLFSHGYENNFKKVPFFPPLFVPYIFYKSVSCESGQKPMVLLLLIWPDERKSHEMNKVWMENNSYTSKTAQ